GRAAHPRAVPHGAGEDRALDPARQRRRGRGAAGGLLPGGRRGVPVHDAGPGAHDPVRAPGGGPPALRVGVGDLGGTGKGPRLTAGTPYRYDASAFREVFERRFTYLAGVHRNSHRYADRPALHDPATDRRWTYSELWADSGRLAAGLRARGVQAGDVVVLDLFNCPEFVLVWLAAQRLGAIAAPINFRLSSGEVAHVLDDSRPAVFIHDAALTSVVADALARASHTVTLAVVVTSDGGDAPPGCASTPFTEIMITGTVP